MVNPTLLISKNDINRNLHLKKAQKQEKRTNGKGSRKPLKNYLGKIVSLVSYKSVCQEESRISSFVSSISREELLTAIESAKLTGMSGNGFYTHIKIKEFLSANSKNRILLINAVECDPALLHDEWLLDNRYVEIMHTIHYLLQALSLEKAVLATKRRNIKSSDKFSVAVVPPRYPMGEERFLIHQVFGIHLENNEIPAEHGILVLNIQTIYQIGKIINQCYDGGRFITIADLTEASAKIAYVYPTDKITNLLVTHFGEKNKENLYKGFGAMACTKVTETDNFSNYETFAAYANPPRLDNKNKCRRCGNCKRKCPMNIDIAKIVQLIDKNQSFDYDLYNPERCIQCGCCTYFCPALKNVSGYVAKILDK